MAIIFITTFPNTFFNENVSISIKISLKFVPKGPINKVPALVQIMAWRRPGDKPLSEPMMIRLPTHICVTRPQLVNIDFGGQLAISNMTCAKRFVYLSPIWLTFIICKFLIDRIKCMLRNFFAFSKYVKINFECLISIRQKKSVVSFVWFQWKIQNNFSEYRRCSDLNMFFPHCNRLIIRDRYFL